MKQCCEEKHVDLLLIGEGEKKLKIALKLMVKKRLRCLRKVNMLNSKILKKI